MNKNSFFSALIPGDTIDLIAQSSKCDPKVLPLIQTILAEWGFKSYAPDNVFGDSIFFANTHEIRFSHLKNALFNPTSKAIWSLVGGCGCTKLIPMLEKLEPPKNSKIFIGLSDATALHIFLQQKWNWITLHGPGARQIALNQIDDFSVENFKQVLLGKYSDRILDLEPMNDAAKQVKNIISPIIGGNLTVAQHSLGTSWQICANNKILLLEDVNERGYKIDRALEHFNQANIFSQVKAVILGDFMKGDEPSGKNFVDFALNNFAKNNHFPVFRARHVGHDVRNITVPLGIPLHLHLKSHKYILSWQ